MATFLFEDLLHGRRRDDDFDDPYAAAAIRRSLMSEEELYGVRGAAIRRAGMYGEDIDDMLAGGMDMGYGPFEDDGFAPRGRRRRNNEENLFSSRRGGRAGGFGEDLYDFNELPYEALYTGYDFPMDDFQLFDDLGAYHQDPYSAPTLEDDLLADLDRGRARAAAATERDMELFAPGARDTLAEDLSRIWDDPYGHHEDPDAPWNRMDSIEYDPDPMAVFRSAVYDPPRRHRDPSPSITSGYRLPPGAGENRGFPRHRRIEGSRMENPQADMLLGARPLDGGRADTPMPGDMGPPPRRSRGHRESRSRY